MHLSIHDGLLYWIHSQKQILFPAVFVKLQSYTTLFVLFFNITMHGSLLGLFFFHCMCNATCKCKWNLERIFQFRRVLQFSMHNFKIGSIATTKLHGELKFPLEIWKFLPFSLAPMNCTSHATKQWSTEGLSCQNTLMRQSILLLENLAFWFLYVKFYARHRILKWTKGLHPLTCRWKGITWDFTGFLLMSWLSRKLGINCSLLVQFVCRSIHRCNV